jgi:hypothetical protein
MSDWLILLAILLIGAPIAFGIEEYLRAKAKKLMEKKE